MFDQGINAALLNYSINSNYFNNQRSEDRYSTHLFLEGGFNLGAWRYRNQSSYTKYKAEASDWNNISNKLERDLISIRSRVEIGDSHSSNEVFDSYNFRGIQLSSDDLQLPSSLQRYAPVIRGVANSNAVVEIRQNSYLIYSTNVAAGHFVIRDLYAANESGDLEVRVLESNGSVRRFIQPYSSVPHMLREGQWKYQFTAGRYRQGDKSYAPYIGQFTLSRGLNNVLTPYGGLLVAEDYYAMAGGLAWSLGRFGAFSTDLTYAHNTLASGQSQDGASVRFLYAKTLNRYGTNLNIIGYRYSAQGYYSLSEAVQEKAQWRNGVYEYTYTDPADLDNPQLSEKENQRYYYDLDYFHRKQQFQASINQSLGKWGQIYANLTQVDYWNDGTGERNWQVGYNNHYKQASYSLYYQNTESIFTGRDYNIGLSISLPLEPSRKMSQLTSSHSYQYTPVTGSLLQSAVSGSFLENKNLQLQAQVGYSETSHENLNLNAAYQGTKGTSNLGYSYNPQYQQYSAALSGGLLLHSGGLVIGQQLNTNPILIEAHGAEGTRVENQTGLKIDRHGYAVMNGSSAYRRNRVALHAEDLPATTNMTELIQNDVVPTKNAVVKVRFKVQQGQSVLAKLQLDQAPVITGANVYTRDDEQVGLVGLDGAAFLTGVHSGQVLIVKWGEENHKQCQFKLPALSSQSMGYDEVSLTCLALGE